MEKSKDLKEQEAKKIYDQYKEQLKDYGIKSFEELKVQILPEYLAERWDKQFGPASGNEFHYKNNDNLNEVYVFQGKEEAYFFGTDKAIIQGHIANENLKDGKITFSEEMREKYINPLYATDHKKAKEMEENYFHGDGKDLLVLEKLLEKPEEYEKLKQQTKNKMKEVNDNNGIHEEEKEKEEGEDKIHLEGEPEEQEEKSSIPPDVVKACKRLGITNLKGYVYGNAEEFVSKTDIPNVDKNAGNVLIIRTADSGKDTDKYYVFQNDKLCVPGNKDEDIDKIARKTTQNQKNGTLMKPIEIDDEEQWVEYADSQGLVIKEKLEEAIGLSTEDLANYQREIQEMLEKYSEALYAIENNGALTDSQRDEMYVQVNEHFNAENEKIASKYGISFEDVKAINLETDESTQKKIDEEEEEVDATGKPVRPGTLTH